MKTFSLRLPNKEHGQSTVIVALFLFFVFLAFAALTVDTTIIYLHRRHLQNVADAAALGAAIQLAQGETEATAYSEAEAIIAANNGRTEWYATDPAAPNPPTTNTGTGLNLTSGIEITDGCDVRVALTWGDIGTYFAQFVGRGTLQVGVNARAGCNQAGGLQPIAVKRFGDAGDTPTNSDSIDCDKCDTRITLADQEDGVAYDFLRPEDSDSDIISAWPDDFYDSPSPFASTGSPGREYYFLGGNTNPNVGTPSYAGWIDPDIRKFPGPHEYYNGIEAGSNVETLREYAEYYIRRGYCCDIPNPGDQVAMFSGVGAAFGPKPFRETYDIGDIVAVIVYNGTVYKAPTLQFAGAPNNASTYPISTTTAALNAAAIDFTLTLEAKDGFVSSPQGLTMDVEGLDGFADWSFSPTNSPKLPITGSPPQYVRTLTLHITPTITTTVVGTTTVAQVITGTRMFYVSAKNNKNPDTGVIEEGRGVSRYWAGVVSIGDENGNFLPAVTAMPTNSDQNYPFLIVEQGDKAAYDIVPDLWGGAGNQNVKIELIGSAPTGLTLGGLPWEKTIKNPNTTPRRLANVSIDVDKDTAAIGMYTLQLLATAADGMTQTLNLYLQVAAPKTVATNKDYVEILGYAALEVTGYEPNDNNPNSVRGRIVSELWDDPSQLTTGRRARLIPWNQ